LGRFVTEVVSPGGVLFLFGGRRRRDELLVRRDSRRDGQWRVVPCVEIALADPHGGTPFGKRTISFLVPKLCLGTQVPKLCFEYGAVSQTIVQRSKTGREAELRGVRSQAELGNERTSRWASKTRPTLLFPD